VVKRMAHRHLRIVCINIIVKLYIKQSGGNHLIIANYTKAYGTRGCEARVGYVIVHR
jgi:hypothetical protein